MLSSLVFVYVGVGSHYSGNVTFNPNIDNVARILKRGALVGRKDGDNT
jgi:hypothetical protein